MQNDSPDATVIQLLAELGPRQNAALAIAAAIVIAACALGIYSNLLRDQSNTADKPFSLSRLQLLWWTVIIGIAVALYYGAHGQMPTLTETCLVLLGIGAGTTMTARIIDERQRTNAELRGNVPLHQDEISRGFFEDVLSDDNGLSVHRFQALMFNFVYGAAFLYGFLSHSTFPDYDAYVLSLLGISSAGYLGIKTMENSKPVVPGQNDELLDAVLPASQQAVG